MRRGFGLVDRGVEEPALDLHHAVSVVVDSGELAECLQDLVPAWFPDAFDSPFFLAAVMGLTLYNSAVIAEIMRAGIVSLERGQGEAAAALGLPYWKSMRLVILPQGLRRMVPATVSQLITLNKDTTLVSIIAIQEVMRQAGLSPPQAAVPSPAPASTLPCFRCS